MSGETMSNVEVVPRLTIAEGMIDPDTRVAKGEITEAEIQDFVERLQTDEFYDEVEQFKIPNKCVDGRSRKDGVNRLGADAAGGTFSVVVGDALTTNRYRRAGEKAPAHARRMYDEFSKAGYLVGVHEDDHAEGQNCGCGAEDKFDAPSDMDPSILRYITRRSGDIRDTLGTLGIVVDDATHDLITSNARGLIIERYATNGAELRDAAEETTGEESVETLTGPHLEGLLGINTRPGRTLNRARVAEAYNGNLQAFNLDVPVLKSAAEITSITPEEADQKFIAMLYYNVATAAVLAGPSLRIVAR